MGYLYVQYRYSYNEYFRKIFSEVSAFTISTSTEIFMVQILNSATNYTSRHSMKPLAMVYGDDDHYHLNNRKAEEQIACAGKSIYLIVNYKRRWLYYADSVCVTF